MLQEIKDWTQIGVWAVGIFAGVDAARRSRHEMRENREQRREELRWRRANAAREILDVIHRHERACCAVTMMDWSEGKHDYAVGPAETLVIDYADVLRALGTPQAGRTSAKDRFISDCFDWFFYYVDRIRHYVKIGLLVAADVDPPFAPYVKLVRADVAIYRGFLRERGYSLAEPFLCGPE